MRIAPNASHMHSSLHFDAQTEVKVKVYEGSGICVEFVGDRQYVTLANLTPEQALDLANKLHAMLAEVQAQTCTCKQ